MGKKDDAKEEVLQRLIAVLFLLYILKNQMGALSNPSADHKPDLSDYAGKYGYMIGTQTGTTSAAIALFPIFPDLG